MTVLVTGASSGLGLHTARMLHEAGYTVIGGARSFAKPADEPFRTLPLDVTDEGSVAEFVRQAQAISPRIDAVVHCAGLLVLGPCEETSPEEYRRVWETCFLGAVQVNQAVLPVMRRQGRGRIVMLSSINGLLGIPFQSAYTAAKHALEGYAECLAMETRPHGVSVCLVEPGDHRSGSSAYRPHAKGMGDASPYADAFRSAVTVIGHDEANGADPDALGRCVARLLRRRRMPLRKVVASADQHLAVWLKRLFPPEMLQTVLRAYYLGRKS